MQSNSSAKKNMKKESTSSENLPKLPKESLPATGSQTHFLWKKHAPRQENLENPLLYKRLEELGYLHIPITQIGPMIGVSASLINDMYNSIPEIKEAVQRGRAQAIADATAKYMNNFVLNDNALNQARSIEFLLERKGGWVKSPDVAVQVNNNTMQPLTISDSDLDNLLEN